MNTKDLSTSKLHKVPRDLSRVFNTLPSVHMVWKDITPLARNEWLCWILSAKKEETRERRIRIMQENLLQGKRRPCCFAGCPHRGSK